MVLSIKIALIRRLYTHLTLVFDCIGYNPSLGDLNLWIFCTGFAAPAAVGKRVDTCGFYPLNSRFPLLLSLAQTGDRRPLRNLDTTEDFFFRMFLNIFAVSDTVLLHIWFTLRRRNITVLRNSFTRCYVQHLRIPLYQQTLPQGAPRWIDRRAREGALGYDLGAPFVNHLHTPNRRGAQCAPRKCLILRCVGANVCHSLDAVYLHIILKRRNMINHCVNFLFPILHYSTERKKGPETGPFLYGKALT